MWQLHRLWQRQERNAKLTQRLSAAPVVPRELPSDTADAHYRRVVVSGQFDFDHQVVLADRSHQGSPGVYLLTPLEPDSGGTAILVNRGWVYSPDAVTVNLAKWDEPAHASITGYVEEFTHGGEGNARTGRPDTWRRLDGDAVRSSLPYDVEPYYIVAFANGPPSPTLPARMTMPAIDEGPHRSYAIQWFSFAAIAVIGVATLIWQDRSRTMRNS